MSAVRQRHIERLPAREYYGHRSPVQVVLVDGHVMFHGKGHEARKFEERVTTAVRVMDKETA